MKKTDLKIVEKNGWIFYINPKEVDTLTDDKCGKWMYFFKPEDIKVVSNFCKQVITDNIVVECKHTCEANAYVMKSGVICFYLNIDDTPRHKKIIEFFLKNNLIRKTPKGKLYNISFKLDTQTLNMEYGKNFKSELKLDEFVDLETGKMKK